ncbi:MAG: serine hydrolase [Chloroflexi bacterium]|nr:serine hydrolase [Chloroflexota bacterium]
MIFTISLLVAGWVAQAQRQNFGVYAQAIGQANLRADDHIEARLVGEIRSGVSYPVLGRSQLYPWLLLGESDTDQPLGWVFETLVVVSGDINRVPFSDLIIDASAPPSPVAPSASPAPASTATSAPPTSTPTIGVFGVSGRVSGEVNIRYGPGVEYPRAGVAYTGDRFEVTGYHALYPWVRIRYPEAAGGQAWMASDLLEISGNVFNTVAISQTRFSLPPFTPTPAAVQASGINGEQALPLGGDLQILADELWNLLLRNDFDPQTSRFGALFFMDLASGEAFAFGDKFAFSGTSLNKVAILAKLYQKLDAPPSIETATDILNTMICSENAATNRLLSIIGDGNAYVGADAVTKLYQELGLTRSFLIAPFTTIGTPEPPPQPLAFPETTADQARAEPDLSNQLTVVEIGSLLANLYQCAYAAGGALIDRFGETLETRECRQMLHVMSNNTVDALLKSGVPADTRVAHKHGWIPDTHGNAALFFTPGGDYVIAMMLFQPEWLNFQESLPLFAEVSRRVYNHFNPEQPQASGREWNIPDANSCNYFGSPLVVDLLQSHWDE